jgi:hypothetical protein
VYQLKIAAVSLLILALQPLSEVLAQPEPQNEVATNTGSALGIGFLLSILVYIVLAAIAVITIFVLRKKRLIF